MSKQKIKLFNRVIYISLLVAAVVFNYTVSIILVISPAKAQVTLVDIPVNDPDPLISFSLATESWERLECIERAGKRLRIPPTDQNRLANLEVDYRVTNYLLRLALPTDCGGSNIEHIKVEQIFKSFESNGIGKFDRETLAAMEEDVSLVSRHHTGQAVDISEIGQITCKVVEHRHGFLGIGGGTTTKWRSPVPVKVAWQSKSGISRHPTPSGDSLIGVAGGMTNQSLLTMFNSLGTLDYPVDYLRGSDLETIGLYLGANALLKTLGVKDINADPLSSTVAEFVGINELSLALPSFSQNMGLVDNSYDARVAYMINRIEEGLSLPPGSLRGKNWEEVLRSTGKRHLENSLGLPALYLEDKSPKDLTSLDAAKAAISFVKRNNDALNLPSGTVEALSRDESKGYLLAGVNILSNSLKLDEADKNRLVEAINSGKKIDIDVSGSPLDKIISNKLLADFLAEDASKRNSALEQLKQLGYEAIDSSVKNKTASQAAKVILEKLSNPKKITIGELKKSIGDRTIALLIGADPDRSPNSRAYKEALANYINSELGLEGEAMIQIKQDEEISIKSDVIFKKIAGSELDKALGWDNGVGEKVLKKEIKVEDAFKSTFTNAIEEIIGVDITGVDFDDPASREALGLKILVTRLGITIDEPKIENVEEYIQNYGIVATSQNNEQKNLDAIRSANAKLGVPQGTIERYLANELDDAGLIKLIATENIIQIGVDGIRDYFNLEGSFSASEKDIESLLRTVANWDNVEFEEKDKAFKTVFRIIGRSLDKTALMEVGTLTQFIVAENNEDRAKILMDMGLKYISQSIGFNVDDFDADDVKSLYSDLKEIYNESVEEGDQFFKELKNYISNPVPTPGGRVGTAVARVKNIVVNAFNIPEAYSNDAFAFISGDFSTAMAIVSFNVWQKEINQYLPEDYQLTYAELRDTIIPNEKKIQQRIDVLNAENQTTVQTEEEYLSIESQARREITNESRRNTEYKISDGFLRKADPSIPVGFTKTMFAGTDAERADLILSWAFTKVESIIGDFSSDYEKGLLEKLYRRELTQADGARLIGAIVEKITGFEGGIAASVYQFASASPSQRETMYADPKYNTMWSYFDGQLQQSLGINLPSGASQSIFLASQNNWDFDSRVIRDGQVVVPSLSDLANNVVTAKLTAWADKALNLPAGTTFQVYQSIKGVADASRALSAARAAGDAAATAQAGSQLQAAQAQLTMLAISIALNACSVCQQVFGAIDQALQAPPGFTQALVTGAIAMSLGLGPAGLIIAAAIYFFGVYKVEYLCPLPPKDPYAITSFDSPEDVMKEDFGYELGEGQIASSRPRDPLPGEKTYEFGGYDYGENPFDWDDNVKFTDGNKSEVWMGWARYYTGRLIDEVLTYAESQPENNKPNQLITYRQANAEFFADRQAAAFGPNAVTAPNFGLGFTQKSTKITDWIHIGFGGYY